MPDGLTFDLTDQPAARALARRTAAGSRRHRRARDRRSCCCGDSRRASSRGSLPDTDGARGPFFSPDGAWIGFFRPGGLYKLPVAGGPPVRLAEATSQSRGAAWGEDGFVYFTSRHGRRRVARLQERRRRRGRDAARRRSRDERTHRWPEVLPGGAALHLRHGGSTEYYDDARIEAVRPATGERKVLIESASMARYAASGHLVFARGGSLFAVAFDPRSLSLRGSPPRSWTASPPTSGSGAVQFALSASGALLWAPARLQRVTTSSSGSTAREPRPRPSSPPRPTTRSRSRRTARASRWSAARAASPTCGSPTSSAASSPG